MKCCTKCKQEKPRDAFTANRHVKSGLASWCKACVARQNAESRVRNPGRAARHNEKSRRRYERHREQILAAILNRKCQQQAGLDVLKRLVGCRDCGTVEGQLAFDHRPGEVKSFQVSKGLGASWQRLWDEVAKCDVRCTSCHWHRHAAAGDLYLFSSLAR